MPTIGENLRRIRKDRHLGQVELAQCSGVAQPTISGIERDHRDPHPSTLRKLAEAMDVPVAAFFQEDRRPKVPPSPKTPLARSTPEALETRLYGAPATEIEGELQPVLDEPQARALSDAARQERDAVEGWLKEYADAPTEERFERRADHEQARELRDRARFYHDLIFDYWTKLHDPRPVPFKGAQQFAAEQAEAQTLFVSALENEAERQRIKHSGEAG